MQEHEDEYSKTPERRYPLFWEKAVPVVVAIISVIIVILLLISIAVVMGLFPGSG